MVLCVLKLYCVFFQFREAEEKTRKVFEEMDEHRMKKGPDGKKKKFYSDNSFGLLRFIRNLHAH